MTDTTLDFDALTTPHNGVDTSMERAADLDESGVAHAHQTSILLDLGRAGYEGLTTSEFAMRAGYNALPTWVTGTFTTLHKAGHISRLVDKRGEGRKSHIYVLNRYVLDRPTKPYLGQGKNILIQPHERENIREVIDAIDAKASANPLWRGHAEFLRRLL